MSQFLETQPKLETMWRAIILFGRNVATYKFALGKSLLDLANEDKTFISMKELAVYIYGVVLVSALLKKSVFQL